MRFRPRLTASFAVSALACAALARFCGGVARADDTPPFGADFAIKNGDRVVFYGDSITDQREYTIYTEEYIATRFPKLDVTFTHSGWGGDSVTGGGGGPIDTRLDRDVTPYHPTVVTIMLGMNDAGYRAFDQARFDTYSAGYKHIADKIKKDNPGVRLTFIEPSPYDDVTQPPTFPGGYNAVLVRYGDYLKTLGAQEGASLADFNAPVNAMLAKAYAANPDGAKKIIPDRIHPSWGGHLVMAEALLRSWNAPSLVSSVAIHPTSGKSETTNAQVGKIATSSGGSVVSWSETEGALPFPIQPPEFWNADPFNLALKSSDFVQALDREMLTVTDLAPGRYSLKIDNKDVGTFTTEQLAAGVNLATLETPMLRQAEWVNDLTRRHSDLHNSRWRDYQVSLPDNPTYGKFVPTIMNDLDAAEANVLKARHAAAQPVAHQFSLVPHS